MRGDGRIFRRGRILWITYSRNGREHRETSGGTDEDAARRLPRNRLSTATAGSLTIRDVAMRSNLLERLPDQESRDLYADCVFALRRLRIRLASKSRTKGA